MYDVKQGFEPRDTVDAPNREEAFGALMHYIKSLPADQRAVEAVRISSQLLEFTAFEVAGSVDSERVGALIECAAKLCDPDIQGYDPRRSADASAKRVSQ
jgi:hypothetical protein